MRILCETYAVVLLMLPTISNNNMIHEQNLRDKSNIHKSNFNVLW